MMKMTDKPFEIIMKNTMQLRTRLSRNLDTGGKIVLAEAWTGSIYYLMKVFDATKENNLQPSDFKILYEGYDIHRALKEYNTTK